MRFLALIPIHEVELFREVVDLSYEIREGLELGDHFDMGHDYTYVLAILPPEEMVSYMILKGYRAALGFDRQYAQTRDKIFGFGDLWPFETKPEQLVTGCCQNHFLRSGHLLDRRPAALVALVEVHV